MYYERRVMMDVIGGFFFIYSRIIPNIVKFHSNKRFLNLYYTFLNHRQISMDFFR